MVIEKSIAVRNVDFVLYIESHPMAFCFYEVTRYGTIFCAPAY
jgi:hypothetical protein